YAANLNEAGKNLFLAMARGAIAQINNQSVLTLGSKVTDKFRRALDIIENRFLLDDILSGNTGPGTYTQFKRDRSVLFSVIQNYDQYSTTGVVFRAEKLQTALESLEKGFGKEI